ncbi:Rodlet protein [Aspergillus cristatus]|uniref:Hydrophobin n=1 Tax=Aspergillus cristatus TaxID=573508 RepID=A0A1E3B873_ASPCR|nr:Rodlet protein [Aspergillus cristatus]
MKFLAITTFLATALAIPTESCPKDAGQVTLKQAQNKCGSQAKVSCCNKKIESGDSYNQNKGLLSGGILNGLLGGKGSEGLGVFDQCTLLGLDNILSDQCKQNIACCDGSNAKAEGGLVNVALPCVVLQDLL